MQAFEPFTISPVLKVQLETATPHLPLPSTMILKLFDRRFSNELREWHDVSTPCHESEAKYRSYVSHEHPKHSVEEWAAKFLADEENDIEPPAVEREAHLEALFASYHESEVQVYDRLCSLQGNALPLFFGQTRFVVDVSSPESIDVSVPGILLEYVPGQKLSELSPPLPSDDIGFACVDIVNACGDAGVLNSDVRLENFIVPSVQSRPERPVVMIDFAQCRFRANDVDDMAWKKDKWSVDEEGAVGYPLGEKFGWKYQPSWKYLITEDDD
jgi:hypothetical protein